MNYSEDFIDSLLEAMTDNTVRDATNAKAMRNPLTLKKANNKAISYTSRHRGVWFRSEYDFDEIQIAQDQDSYLSRSIQKKVNKLLCAGYEFVGNSAESVDYVKRRFKEIQYVTQKPLIVFLTQLYADLFRFSNCMVLKVRNAKATSGKSRTTFNNVELEPVAGLFVLPFETLQFKTRANGELKKVLQYMPTGEQKEYFPADLVHFYTNRKPGFAVGTPELLPALDDIQLLRRVEENVEELIETNLFPVFHYRVGNDQFPERVSPQGEKESDIVRRTVEYMPASGVYISDHRHEISSLGSEGKALRIDFYLNYFKNRVFAAIGASPIDMGEGDTATRSTASTMSKSMMMDVEAIACIIKEFFDFYILDELLMEGGYDPMDEDQKVEIRFGVIDKDEKRAQENHVVQTFANNVRDMDETRKALGEKPWRDEQMERTHYKMFEEPSAMVKGMSPGSAVSEVLADLPSSNLTPEAVAKEKAFAEKQAKAAAASKGGQSGARPSASGTGTKRASAARNRPSNQTGTRSTAKTNSDLNNKLTMIYSRDNSNSAILELPNTAPEVFQRWLSKVETRYNDFKNYNISFQTIAENMLWQLKEHND